MKECDDYVLYDWNKADVVADKKKIEEFLTWEGEFNGRGKPTDGKIFK